MLNGIFTGACFFAFIAIVIWAYSGKRKARFDEASRLPLLEENDNDSHRGLKS